MVENNGSGGGERIHKENQNTKEPIIRKLIGTMVNHHKRIQENEERTEMERI